MEPSIEGREGPGKDERTATGENLWVASSWDGEPIEEAVNWKADKGQKSNLLCSLAETESCLDTVAHIDLVPREKHDSMTNTVSSRTVLIPNALTHHQTLILFFSFVLFFFFFETEFHSCYPG